MGIEIKQNTIAIRLVFGPEDGSVTSTIHDPEHDDNHVLPLHYSIMGEVQPRLAPLSIDYSLSSEGSYRYDRVVGIGPPSEARPWDWMRALRPARALAVQLAIDCRDSGIGFSDASPALLGLQPSLNTPSVWDKYADKNRQAVQELARLAQPYVPVLPGIAQVAANYISSGNKDNKTWWMYRFFEEKLFCAVIEWNINDKVLWEYGPLLRGSVVLSFHGEIKNDSAIRLILRPRLGFDQRKDFEGVFVPSILHLEADPKRLVALDVRPVK